MSPPMAGAAAAQPVWLTLGEFIAWHLGIPLAWYQLHGELARIARLFYTRFPRDYCAWRAGIV